MALINPGNLKGSYDVVVVGSGAGGGQAAYTLTLEGASVLMIEAGRNYDPVRETAMFQSNADAPLRGTGTPDKPRGFFDATVDGGWQVPGEPYTNASAKPEEQFTWWRSRMLGGRTNHWGRNSFRNGPYDFKPRTRDGLGFDWPVTYADIAPYYDKVEMLIGVYGDSEGIENSPDSPPGVLLPPPAARTGELLARKHARSLGIPVVPAHRAVLSTRLDDRNIPAKLHPGNPRAQRLVAESMRARAACLWATHCHRGCSVGAAYQSTTVHLPPALASGLLDVLPDAMVREVTLDARGRADGVIFIDKRTGREARARGRAVVLAASSAETVRIMLNSRSPSFPQGLGNSTGLVGRYITDTVGASFGGQVPQLESLPPLNEDGAGGLHVYVPWWLCREQAAGRLDFPRGYHIEFATGRTMPGIGIAAGAVSMTRGGYGRRFKEDMRRYFGSFVTFTGRGEMIPNAKSFCELDPQVKDRWGIPVLRFHWQWSDHELRQVVHMQRTFADLIVAMGGKVRGTPDADGRRAIVQPGAVIHEVGGAIMGADAHSSVTNRWSQVWDVPNVILADGAPFASNADKNPTLTIMALAWRACDHLLSEMKRGNL